jgi:hypothetical protein
MSAEVLRDALERRLGHLPLGSSAVSELKQLTGGASRETWTFTATDADEVRHESCAATHPARKIPPVSRSKLPLSPRPQRPRSRFRNSSTAAIAVRSKASAALIF